MMTMMNNRNNSNNILINGCLQPPPPAPLLTNNDSSTIMLVNNRHKSPVQNKNPNEIYSNLKKPSPPSAVTSSTTHPVATSSGSETDVSTSTENLSPEEHYVLKTSTRQEPQGEETYFGNDPASGIAASSCTTKMMMLALNNNNNNHHNNTNSIIINNNHNISQQASHQNNINIANQQQPNASNNNTLIIHGNDSLNHSIYSYITPLFNNQQQQQQNSPPRLTNRNAQTTFNNNQLTTNLNNNNNHHYLNINLNNQQQQMITAPGNANNIYHGNVGPQTSLQQQQSDNIQKNNLTTFIDQDNPYSNLNLLKFAQMNITNEAANNLRGSSPSNNNNDNSVIQFQQQQSSNTNSDNKLLTANNAAKMMNTAMSNSSNSTSTSTVMTSNSSVNNVGSSTSIINLQQPMLNNYLNSLKKNDSLMFKNFNVDVNVDLPHHAAPQPPPPSNYDTKPSDSFIQTPAVLAAAYHQLNHPTKSLERFTISRSHPDLSKFTDDEINGNSTGVGSVTSSTNAANNNCNIAAAMMNQHSPNSIRMIDPSKRSNSTQAMKIEVLLLENSHLRVELDACYKKAQKVQKLESEIQKVYQSYDELMKSSEKMEKFEREARYKLEIEVKKLQKQNKYLQERLDQSVSKKLNCEESDIEKELNKRGALISCLLAKNKELINYKERQEIELEAQRLTLQEQRNHIEILDTALINAQNNIMTLENELRAKQGWEEKTLFLEKALSNLQSTNERRLQMEKRMRTFLEKELEKYKKQQNSNNTNEAINNGQHKQTNDLSDTKDANSNDQDDVEQLKNSIVNYEKRIIDLEAEVSKWEQKYLEENTLRSIEVSAASAPKDAKIAALERTSQESERLIAEARTERLKHMDEIHLANKKCAELESQLKDMNFKLAEKEAIIKVLQKHSDDRDAVLQKTLRFTSSAAAANPARHTKSASTMGLVASNVPVTTGVTSPSNDYHQLMLANAAQIRAAAAAAAVVADSTNNPTNNPAVMNFDDQLKEIDAQLSNKDNNSIINALRSEKERYPNHYNNWRL